MQEYCPTHEQSNMHVLGSYNQIGSGNLFRQDRGCYPSMECRDTGG